MEMANTWQNLPYTLPTYINIFGFHLRFYGLMYIVGFVTIYLLLRYRLKTEKLSFVDDDIVASMEGAFIGVLVGGRLGYVLFYNFAYYIQHPLEAILPIGFDGGIHFTGYSGMSYHGGMIGVIIAALYIMKTRKFNFWTIGDFFIPAVPLGFTWGRIGNFLNGELWGRETSSFLGMYFPNDSQNLLRHPSQLYEAFFEGIVLFAILWPIRRVKFFKGRFAGMYIFGYGFVRFFVEFVREPDEHLGFILFSLSMGQLLCIGMMLLGAVFFYFGGKNIEKTQEPVVQD